MRARVAAVHPLALGVTLGMVQSDGSEGTLAHPMTPAAFLWLSVGLAVTHQSIVVGYLAVAMLTVWGLTDVWLGAVLFRTTDAGLPPVDVSGPSAAASTSQAHDRAARAPRTKTEAPRTAAAALSVRGR